MKPPLVLLLIFYSILFCAKLHAEMQTSSNEISMARPSPFFAEAEFSHYSFVRSQAEYFGADEKSTSLTSLGVGIKSETTKHHVDAHWFYVPEEEFHYINAPELSLEVHGDNSNIWLGRHIHQWSQADEFWDMGAWQPRFRWNYLKPVQNGFTGVFYSTQMDENTSVHLFMSGLFIPDLSPQYHESQGKIISKNPWFKTPPPVVNLFSEDTEVVASVIEPSVQEIVLRPSLAVQIQKKWGKDYSTQAGYAYKPVNKLRTTYAYYVRATDATAVVSVHPQFPYEQVATLESSIVKGSLVLTPSLTHQEPVSEVFPVERIGQEIVPITTGSLTLRKQIDAQSESAGSVYVGAIRTWSRVPRDIGENSTEKSQFELRQPFFLAYRAGIEGPIFRHRGRPINTRIQGTYDSRQEGAIFTTEVGYSLAKNLNVNFELNIIGATSSRNTEYESGLIRTYRANDNLNLGMNYVF